MPNHAFERTGQQLRRWLPSSLRSSSAAQRERLDGSAMNKRLQNTGDRVYNQMRISLAVLSPGFALARALGVLEFGELRSGRPDRP